MNQQSNNGNVTVARPAKSMVVAFLLAFFFGPLGMLYSTVPGALIMLAINAIAIPIISLATFGMGWFLYVPSWLTCILWSMLAVRGRDRQVWQSIRQGDFAGAARTTIDALDNDASRDQRGN